MESLSVLQAAVAWNAAGQGAVALRRLPPAVTSDPSSENATAPCADGGGADGGCVAAGSAARWGLHFPTPLHAEVARRCAFDKEVDAETRPFHTVRLISPHCQ